MSPQLQNILDLIKQSPQISDADKAAIEKAVKETDKTLEIANFKLDRTEKVKRTTAILLEETIQELELKRKAVEEQNRELGIESSLERVRTVAMSMVKPDDLLNICKAVFKELSALGVDQIRNSIIHTFNDEAKFFMDYDYSDFSQGVITKMPYDGNSVIDNFLTQIRRSDNAFAEIIVQGRELEEWKEYRKECGQPDDPRLNKTSSLCYYVYSIGQASIGISTFGAIAEEKIELLKRFRNVFDFAYRRYTDVANAEAQAREAKIEMALERVRSRTMAMQKSEELKEVIQVVYEQFVHLNINTEHTGFVMDYKERDDRLIWVASKHGVPSQLTIPYFDSEYYNSFNEAKEQGRDFFATNLSFEDKNSFYRELFKYIPGLPEDAKEFYFNCPGLAISTVLLENVGLYIENFEGIPYSDEDNAILMRFGKVFQQTYTRFLDLQKAEAQAREAKIEAGLERVRSRAMAMQTSEELNALIGTVFTELTKLDLVLMRCVIIIYDPATLGSHWWMANSEAPDQPMNFFVKYHTLPFFNAYLDAWKKRTLKWQYVLEGEDKITTDNFLFAETELSQLPDFVIAGMKAPGRVYLNASFNSFGNLTLASIEPLSDEHFDILLRFAKVFDLTYTRFNDLKMAEAHAVQAKEDLQKLHAEKKRTEEALAELQATQKQLIQSEKMASLGELTAGIAHEIQNPLNFVNNFSDVSNELLDEMKTELENGNIEDAKAIVNDVKQNLQKILHHGKRADGIVKGMLQHSRTSSGQKELTDINALADEYLRLAYHGFRAKDKTFNAKFETDFDSSIGKINVMSQDIGRVIINLITNAFYAVNEKKKQQKGSYEPVVSVSTKMTKDIITMIVKDNGNGIPQNIIDKIFQPFFTTKPTGQGTGLGLSLAYDIVKAHGGEIKVETKEGEGTTFIILLNENN